jgi:tetratricopeptide (TPR) repeat protein
MIDLDMALRLDHQDALALLERSKLYFLRREFRKTVDDLSRAIDFKPDMMELFQNRGLAYRELQQLLMALNDFNEALNLAPENPQLLCLRAEVYTEMGMLKEAQADCEKAIQIFPQFAIPYSTLASILRAKGEQEEALENFNLALILDPSDSLAYYNRAGLYIERQNYLAAIDDLQKYIALGGPVLVAAPINAEELIADLKRRITHHTDR